MRNILYFTVIILVILISSTAHAFYFTAKGSGAIIDGNTAEAARIAYESAHRRAVTKAMRNVIKLGTEDETAFNRKKSQLLKGPFPYVKGEKEINRQMIGSGLTIEIQIDVDLNELKKYLGRNGVLAGQAHKANKGEFPAIVVIINEDIGGKNNPNPYSARVIRQFLIDNEFEVVDERLMEKSINHDRAVQALYNNDIKSAQAVALQYGAGVVVTGRASAQKSGIQSGSMTVQGASITLEAIKADSAKILASASAEGHYPHINTLTGSQKALEEAAGKAASLLVEGITAGLKSTSQSVLVSVSDINYQQLTVLKQIFERDFPQISYIKQKSFNGRVSKLDITVDGSVAAFTDTLARHNFGTFKLEVINFSPDKVDLVLQMKN